jgi:hypothetical protein
MKLNDLKNTIVFEFSKNFWQRTFAFNVILAIALLVDEKLKEGYYFRWIDVTNNPLTSGYIAHEQFVMMLMIFAVYLYSKTRQKK